MRFGVCISPLDDNTLTTLADAGFDFVEGHVQRHLVPEESDEAFDTALKAIEKIPLPMEAACCFFPGDLKLVGPEVDTARVDRYVRTACQRAECVGIRTLVIGSGGARTAPEGFDGKAALDQLAGHFVRWGPIAQAFGVMLAIEPLRHDDTNVVNTLIEGADLVDRTGHKHVQLLADSWHMNEVDEPAAHIEVVGRRLAHVHVAEAPERTPPGEKYGTEEFREFFAELKKAAYNGRISIEARWSDTPADQLRIALSTLKEAFEQA